ncbi:response regulator [Albidovulum inexpectatum]|nr:response regulator [Albidovulum inexpectatum]
MPLAGMTVLLVEDSGSASEVLGLACVRSGAHVRRAGNLDLARRLFVSLCPDVAVVDLGLPDGSGLDLIREVSKMPGVQTGLIAISGDDRAGDDAMAAGADKFIAKPFPGLVSMVRAMLEVTGNGRGPAAGLSKTVFLQGPQPRTGTLRNTTVKANTVKANSGAGPGQLPGNRQAGGVQQIDLGHRAAKSGDYGRKGNSNSMMAGSPREAPKPHKARSNP